MISAVDLKPTSTFSSLPSSKILVVQIDFWESSPHSKLLVPPVVAIETAKGLDIGDEAAGSLFNENTLMLGTRGVTHVDHDILNACRLGGGPMNAGCGQIARNVGQVDHEISDLPVEGVGRAVRKTIGSIDIAVYEP